jgi:hypothetical protein
MLHLPYMVIICCRLQSHDDSQRRGVPCKQTPLSFFQYEGVSHVFAILHLTQPSLRSRQLTPPSREPEERYKGELKSHL